MNETEKPELNAFQPVEGGLPVAGSPPVKRRLQLTAYLAALAIVVASATYFLTVREDPGGGQPSQNAKAVAAPTSASPHPTDSATDDALNEEAVFAAKLKLQPWGREPQCSTELKPGNNITIKSLIRSNVDNDAALETVALLHCVVPNQMQQQQVIVVERDAAAKIVMKGRVAASSNVSRWISAIEPLVRGVAVTFYEIPPDLGVPVNPQVRHFAWNTGEFRQISGPQEFGFQTGAAGIEVTTSVLAFGPAGADGKRTGQVTVTLRNVSTLESGSVGVVFGGPLINLASYPSIVRIYPIAAGRSVSLTVTFTTSQATLPDRTLHVAVQVFPRNLGADRESFPFKTEEKPNQPVRVTVAGE